jgi:hypothetical protein
LRPCPPVSPITSTPPADSRANWPATALHYSVFDLEAFARLADIARHTGVDLWHWQAPSGASIARALDFLAPFADTTVAWPF